MGDYYQDNYLEYHESTVKIDPSSFLEPVTQRLLPSAVILDVGCGSGRDMLWLKQRGFNIIGFERSPGLAELAKKHSGCQIIEDDFEQYDFSGLSVDAIILVGALVHVPHNKFQSALENIVRGLKQKGYVLVTMKENMNVPPDLSSERVFYLWHDRDLRDIFDNLNLIIVDFSRQESKIRATDVWLGYVLQKR